VIIFSDDFRRLYVNEQNFQKLKTKIISLIPTLRNKVKEIIDWKKVGAEQVEKIYSTYQTDVTYMSILEEFKAKRIRK